VNTDRLLITDCMLSICTTISDLALPIVCPSLLVVERRIISAYRDQTGRTIFSIPCFWDFRNIFSSCLWVAENKLPDVVTRLCPSSAHHGWHQEWEYLPPVLDKAGDYCPHSMMRQASSWTDTSDTCDVKTLSAVIPKIVEELMRMWMSCTICTPSNGMAKAAL